ncbi:MAG TPA: SpoIIE family protein phosphatase [Kineosporiaceae bacterium]|nr:SpoIIE family protein phosphatase [Kineosporiaceae bacterium]
MAVDGSAQAVDDAALLAVIVGQSPVGVGVFDTDARYVRVNRALQRIVGLDLADMLGRTVREVVPGDVGAFADTKLREVIATGLPVIGADLEGRLPSTAVDRSLVVSYFRLEGPDRAVLGAASIVSDVSDRHRTRRALERANARLELLGRAANVLSASLDLEETLNGLGRLVVPQIADHCVVDLVESDDDRRSADAVVLRRYALVHAPGVVAPPPSATGEDPWTPVGRDVRYPAGHPVHDAFVRREAALRHIDPSTFDFEAVAPNPASARVARQMRMRSAIAVPLQARGRVVGVLSLVDTVSGRRQGEEDLVLARRLADRAAVAIDNARLHHRERERGLTLQRSLLPERLPSVPGLRTAARYLPARSGGGEVGGDWYDVVRLPGGRVAIVVGDVMGRGLPAAALMGQLRAALRAYAVQDQAPAEVLTSADELVRGLADDVLVTCVYAVLDPRDGSLAVANAGHVPPLLLGGPGEEPVTLEATGPPLGAGGREDYGELTAVVAPGRTVVLYTDGLVETREADLGTGLQQLAARLAAGPADLDALAADLTRGPERDDDVAVLLVRTDAVTRPATVRLDIGGDPREAARARAVALETLQAWGEPPAVCDVAQLVVSELVTNALRYGAGTVAMQLSRHDDGVVVEVYDEGVGTPRRRRAGADEEGGRGLLLVAAVAAAWGVRTRGGGKVVWCRLSGGQAR